jgi:hypothetical protein
MEDRSDSIVFLTLIDFLLQLIFFGLVVAVWYSSYQAQQERGENALSKFSKNADVIVPTLEGIGPFLKASNVEVIVNLFKTLKSDVELKRLVEALQLWTPKELAEFVNTAKERGVDVNDPETKRRLFNALGGFGRPPCLANQGTKPVIELTAYDDRVEVTRIFDVGASSVQALLSELRQGQVVERSRIEAAFSGFKQKDCAYYVYYVRKTDSESIRRLVERNFRLSNPL